MTDAGRKLMEQALALPSEERRRLGLALLESVAKLEGEDDSVLHDAWTQEIVRRIERVRSGESRPIPWDEAQRRLRESLRKA